MSRILIAGDFCPVSRVKNFLEEKNYALLFKDVRDIIQSVDYAVVNLECPIVIQPASPIVKCGPNLSCESSILEAIRYIGFKMLTLANNHILDYGDEGKVTFYEGNFSDYEEWKKKTLGEAATQPHRIKYKRIAK